MKNLKDVYFGCADADTEANRRPEVFQEVFFDPLNHLRELIHGERFIVRGRKGDGKTAYGAKINLMKDETNVKPSQRSLNDFDNSVFEKIRTYENLGGNPYISFWKCVIIIECFKMIDHYQPHIATQEFTDLRDALSRHGLLKSGNAISSTIKRLVETDTTVSVKSFSHGRRSEHTETLHGAEEIYSAICRTIKNLYLDRDRFMLIIDGFDDILHHTKFDAKIITGLIRAAKEINEIFLKTTLSLKAILLIRNDILDLCRDPNLSKILRDSEIHLAWTIESDLENSNLIQLVKKRFNYAWGTNESFVDIWKEFFVEYANEKPSLEYALENIIYRPRDILQFFDEAQKVYRPGQVISFESLKRVLLNYSKDYFVVEMKDELTGFFPDDVVTTLPDILSSLGSRHFFLHEFDAECKKYPAFKDIPARAILERLFNGGYIGQYKPRGLTAYAVFSYRHEREKFVDEHECILHRGLMRAFNLIS